METVNVNKTKLFPHALYYLVRLSRLTVMHTSAGAILSYVRTAG